MGEPGMSKVTVTEEEFGGFRITIPVAPKRFFRLFLPVWLCGWLAGEVGASFAILASGLRGFGPYFMIFWLAAWTAGGLLAMVSLAWNWFGREVVVIDDGWMVARREIGAFGRSRSFELSRMRDPRYAPIPYYAFARRRQASWQQWGFGAGSIAFEYDEGPAGGPTTHRFGDQLPEFEARRLIATILQRFKIPEGPAAVPLPIQR